MRKERGSVYLGAKTLKHDSTVANRFDVFKDGQRRYQVRTKTAAFALDFETDEEEAVFTQILHSVERGGFSWDVFLRQLPAAQRPLCMDFRKGLEEEGIYLSSTDEKEACRSASSSLCVIGASHLTEEITNEAKAIGFHEIRTLTITSETSSEELENALLHVDFAVVDAHRWSPYHLELVNALCIQQDIPWLYIEGVRGDDISIGPIFWGRKLGCYNCLTTRKNSNYKDLNSQLSYEKYLRKNRRASQTDQAYLEPLRVKMVAHLALLETLKFLDSYAVPAVWRTVVDFNLTTCEVKKSYLLKYPYCPVCNPRVQYNSAPWLEEISLVKPSNRE